MRNITWLLLLTACFHTARAQYSRYLIQFTDKKGTAHSLTTPNTYLSPKALARRTIQHIPIDSTDLPVSATYLDSLRKLPQVTVINTSKWLNQALIQTNDPAALAKINSYPFVRMGAPIGKRETAGNSTATKERFLETVVPLDHPASYVATRQQGAMGLNYGNTYNQIHIHRGEYLHDRGLTGNGITIAILDAGFRNYHTNPALDSVRLQNRLLGTWDYVANEPSVTEDDTHGLYCFSILASNKPGQLVGTAPHASYWLLRTENPASEYPVEEQYWAAAAEFADSAGVDMISSSLGYIDFDDHSFDHTYAQRDGNTSLITRAADWAARKGMIVMNSAGNNGARTDDLKFISCPADGDSVVAVGATTPTGAIASFSSWGPNGKGTLKPNIVSVGQGTVIASLTGTPSSGNGTSFSNPNIAGLIACLWQAFPEVGNMKIIDAVQRSADRYNNPDIRFGYGLPDFKKALVLLTQQQAKTSAAYNNCVVSLDWTSQDDTGVVYSITRKLPGENNFSLLRTVAATSTTFKKNSHTINDTLTTAGIGTVTYQLVQRIGTDTSFLIGTVQQQVSNTCFPANTTRVMPNPFNNELKIVANTPEAIPDLSIQVYDDQGKLIYQQQQSKPAGYRQYTLYTAGWPNGLYKITLNKGNKRFYDQKIIKLP
ncbi:S8 family serine peptidase [Paraflavitalea pollutisoli]|uniref:S8 family serine peptidase n=1 Tax=Paraflavitalea pollutisoli TaxID=3034143 RepID=UPI0023EB4097|nr:S8 family serine peptidase [Paraflavitalea sp. H1-2-19X]